MAVRAAPREVELALRHRSCLAAALEPLGVTVRCRLDAARSALAAIGSALLAAAVAASLVHPSLASAASATCPNGATMAIVAHEDDSILFMNPDLQHDIQSGRCVRTVFVTAGDDGQNQSYWSSREHGAEVAYAVMAGVADTWSQSDAGISGHPLPLLTLSADPKLSIVFMRLPDGNLDGSGFLSHDFDSLQKLYDGTFSQLAAVDGSSSYTKSGLTSVLSSLMEQFAPDKIDTQDFVGTFGDGDHSDHHAVAYFARDAHRAYNTTAHTLLGYMDYATDSQPANVTGADLTEKHNAWFAYAAYDPQVCQTTAQCARTNTWAWLSSQYTVGAEAGGPGITFQPPTANAGPNQTVAAGATVRLDGSGSSDPNGNPSYQWHQTSGPAVTLSSSTAVAPMFTAPSSAATLTFQLVVADGQSSSQPATVTVTVTAPSTNLAPQATVTASSQDTSTGQLAVKAVDGVIGGYPNDPTAEWATVRGKARSWLKLVWAGPRTIGTAVLYDRPNLNDQITRATLTFSNGTTVAVPALNNAGTATTVPFSPEMTTSMLLTVNSVSSATQNVGLAEIQVYAPGSG